MKRVKEWRKKEARLSQAAVAKRLRISQPLYSRYERRVHPWPEALAWKMIELAGGALGLEDFYPKPRARRHKNSRLLQAAG